MNLKVWLLSISSWISINTAQMHGDMGGMGDHHHSCPDDKEKSRILSVADFNGNSIVNEEDLYLIRSSIYENKYHAIMDLNADEELNWDDYDIAKSELGLRSNAFDRQIIKVYKATKKYSKLENAIKDGYRPFTQELKGHGMHYNRLPVKFETDDGGQIITSGAPFYMGVMKEAWDNISDELVEVRLPEGLNYDENGNLVAVFYYKGIDVADWVRSNRKLFLCQSGAITDLTACSYVQQSVQQMTLQAFGSVGLMLDPATHTPMDMGPPHLDYFSDGDGSEMWHQHLGACWDNFLYEAMQVNPEHTPIFDQMLTPSECSAQLTTPYRGYIPAFNMLHLWIFKLNRCGLFAGTDEDVSPLAEPEPVAYDKTRLEFFVDFLGD